MAKEKKKIQNSQKIDLPFEVVQHYFKERQAEKRRAWLIFFVLLSIALIGLAASIALPILMPAIFISMAGGVLLALPILFFNVSTSVLVVYVTNVIRTLIMRTNFKANSIHVASNEKYQNFKHYTLSKGIENDQNCTIFSIDTQKKSIKDKIELFYGIPEDTYLLLYTMASKFEDERQNLERQKYRLQTRLAKLTDENKIQTFRKKIDLIDKKIKKFTKFVELLEVKNKSINDKKHMVLHCKMAIEGLHDILLQNKKLLSKNQSPENKLELVENMRKAFLWVEEAKPYLKSDLPWRESNKPIVDEVIQEVDTLTRFILRAFIETNLKKVLIENPSYYAMYFKYLPREMTEHFSSLLENKALSYNVLKILNGILIEHPSPTDSINQTIHHILANHFYREFKHNKTKQISQQACLHALKLDSSNEANANFKEIVIEAAFFFKGEHDTNLLSDEVQSLLRYSHENPNAYEQIKKSIQDQTSPPAPLQFSESQPDLEAISSSETEKPPSTPPVPPKKLT